MMLAVLLPVAACCSVLALYAWKNREQPGASAFIALMLAAACLCITNIGEVMAPTLEGKMLFNDLSYFPLAVMPVTFLALALQYTGRGHVLTRRNLLLLCLVPMATIALVWTNGLHHLYYTSVTVATMGDVTYLVRAYGPAMVAWMAFAYGLLLVGSLLLVGLYFNTPRQQRGQISLVALGAVVGWAGNIVYMTINPYPFLDTTAVAIFTAGVLVFLGMYRYRLFDITPIARMVVFDRMKHGVIVTDRKGRVVDVNRSALTLLRSDASEVIDLPLTEAFARRPELLEAIARNRTVSEIDLRWGDASLIVEMRICPISQFSNTQEGSVIVLEDVTEQRHAEYELRLAQEKVDMLNGITTHDLMNRAMVIRGYTSLLDEMVTDPKGRDHLGKIVQATESMQRIVRFSKDYQAGKVSATSWRSPYPMFYQVSGQLEASMMELDPSLQGVEIFTDAMLEKVFYNLVENSLRHGGKVTRIRVSAQRNDGHLSIVVEDDGVGIEDHDKETIFSQGYGRNTGYGLFYSRELASVMGFSIEENGVFGRGARFEIRIPEEKFRFREGAEGAAAG
jgi:PAS domain S-box-containing protein